MIYANNQAVCPFLHVDTYFSTMIVLVMGLPGSGKSYFASHLSERLGAGYINSDRTRKSVHSGKRYSPRGKADVYRQMRDLARQALEQDKAVVADATFYRKELRDLFLTLGKEHRVLVHVIQVEAPEDLIKERLSLPREDSEADFKVYQIIRSQFEQLQPDEPHLTLESGRNNIEEMLETALDYIKVKSP